MKKFIQLSAVFLVLLTLSSCKKYLDIEPVGRVIPTTAEDFRALLVTTYNGFPSHRSTLALRTDELNINENVYEFPGFRDIYKWNDNSPDAVTLSFPYLAFYSTIFYANEIIDQVEKRAGVSPVTAQMKGEAYLLRAYSHFELLNLYAKPYQKATAATDRGVVIALTMDLEQNFVPSTVEQGYAQVIADITEGKKWLNTANFAAGKNYRFTTRAALALEARVYEYKGDWAASLAAAQKALQLNNELEDLNLTGSLIPANFNSRENILALERTYGINVFNVSTVSSHLLSIYEQNNDLRFSRYYSKTSNGYVDIKGTSNDYTVSFRNAELYLIQAESALQSDQKDLALQSLLALKAKRLKPAYFETEKTRITALSKDALMQEILKERERELALEGHRWYDLRRYGQPAIQHVVEGATYTLQLNDPRYTLRFPREAIANNPNLQ